MSGSRRRVAVLGSGLVGAAVVAALLDDGRRVRVWGSTPSWYLSAFTDAGASVAATPSDAVAGAEVVVLAPTDDDERSAIQEQLGDRIPPTTTVLTVREPADDERWSATWLTAAGVDHLDCVVFGNPTGLGTMSVVVLVSGAPALVERHRGLLDSLGVAIPLGGPSVGVRRTEIALVGLWYDVNVAILRALANIDPSARPVLELELRAVLAQLPSVVRSVDTGDPVREDAGLALHTRALDTVIAARRHAGSRGTELEEAARAIDTLADRETPRSPLARIAAGLRWSDDTALADHGARPA